MSVLKRKKKTVVILIREAALKYWVLEKCSRKEQNLFLSPQTVE
jgi:phenylpyruvate tautomerase PptA (4-oxalocrotonate tautomerase family)